MLLEAVLQRYLGTEKPLGKAEPDPRSSEAGSREKVVPPHSVRAGATRVPGLAVSVRAFHPLRVYLEPRFDLTSQKYVSFFSPILNRI